MNRVTIHSLCFLITFLLVFIPATGGDCVFAKQKQTDSWKIKESLSRKLNAESSKIDSMSRNLASLKDIILEMQDLGMYPSDLTNLKERNLLYFDKGIESINQKHDLLFDKLSLLKTPLIDAMEILREMVTNGPVPGMFTVLENANQKRINDLNMIKQQIDSLWKSQDSLINSVMTSAGMSIVAEKIKLLPDNDFYKLMQQNSGIQSSQHYLKLDAIKDYLKSKANSNQVNEIFKIEKYRLQKQMDQEDYYLSKRHLLSMQNRFSESAISDELKLLLARVEFSVKDHNKVLSTLSLISDTLKNWDLLLLLKIQSLYSLKEYHKIWLTYRHFDISKLSGFRKNLFIWILIESGIALKIDDDYAQIASLIDNSASYTHHVLHALSRTYLLSGDQKTAFSIMQSALKYKVSEENDRIALKEIKLALAQMYYETGDYDKSLSLFYEILDNNKDFEKALFGIVWCYIKLGNDSKAEIALRKLINLTPESPYSAEAVFMLAEKTLLKANSEWKKLVYLDNEEIKLSSKLSYVKGKQKKNTSKDEESKYNYAIQELKTLLQRLRNESRMDYDSIKILYRRTEKICNLINTHYQTGTFQDVLFSEKREHLLFYLDSTINNIKNIGSKKNYSVLLSNASQNRVKIKNIVKNTKILSAIAAIDEFRWEREFIDWKKAKVRTREMELDSNISFTNDSSTIKHLKDRRIQIGKSMDSIITAEDNILRKYTTSLKSKIDSLLHSDIDSSDAAYLYYQYGELCYTEDNLKYAALYDLYEVQFSNYQKQLNAFRKGDRLEYPVEPKVPGLNHEISIGKFKKVISDYSKSEYVPSAHYSIAWCYNDMSMFDSALNHMQTVALDFPSSPYAAQAWMYSGEYHFERGNLGDALRSYQAVLKYPESEWFEEALYKLAWSQYRLSNPEKAISSFLALVDLGDGTLAGATLLEKESMDYIAISFSESDVTGEKGLERAMIFAKKLHDDERGSRILHRLANVYREQGRYEIAKKTLQSLLNLYPKYPKSAFVESELVRLIEREASSIEINQTKIAIFKKYNHKSTWASMQTELFRKEADSIAQKMLYDASIGYHQYALQKNDTLAYHNALEAYRSFISTYPKSALANECHYNLAEIQFAIGNYYEAAEEYMAVTKRYPDSKYRETAAWNAIVASQNLLKLENSIKTRDN